VYAADAGVEDAIWALTRGSLASQLTYVGASVSHTVSEQINGIMPTVSVTRYTVQVASENFESGGWTGGWGWLSGWSTAGSSDVIKQNSPYQGLYHMRLRSSGSYASRSANLSGQSGIHLTFWAKVNSFESGDTLACQVSPDGSTWTTVKTWTSADSDDTYRYNDINLSPFAPYSSQFRIRFYSGMNQTSDYFYVDNLGLSSGVIAYEITSTAGDITTRSDIQVTGGVVTISLWKWD
jgi:hypothetical protein